VFEVPSTYPYGAFIDGFRPVGDDKVRVDLHERPEAVALRACAIGIVEREHPRRQFLDADAAVGAGEVLAEYQFLPAYHIHHQEAAAQVEHRFYGIGEPFDYIRPDYEPVHHDFYSVLHVLFKDYIFVYIAHFAIDAQPDKAVFPRIFDELLVFALPAAHDRRQQLDPGAFRQSHDRVRHLVDGLLRYLLAAGGAVRDAYAGIQQPEVIVDLRNRTDRGPRVPAGGFLVYGNGRRKAIDVVDIRLFHLPEEPPRVGRRRFH